VLTHPQSGESVHKKLLALHYSKVAMFSAQTIAISGRRTPLLELIHYAAILQLLRRKSSGQ
jgi:hypothetical protein